MSNRLDQNIEKRLEPIRMQKALDKLSTVVNIISSDNKVIIFEYNGSKCSYYPYSGWATGKTIKDGRGLDNLLKQLV